MKSRNLFESDHPDGTNKTSPLAERMRPENFNHFVGQSELIAAGYPLREAIENDTLQSIILLGPPGTGKTTLARIIAKSTQARFVAFSAVLASIKDIKTVMAEAEAAKSQLDQRTIVFVDEIHRFNKAQQDAFLPRVEAGDITLIGATTENPSFEVNAALLSRSKVFLLKPLSTEETVLILRRALGDIDHGLGAYELTADKDALVAIASHANGDARIALNLLELAGNLAVTNNSKSKDGSTPKTPVSHINRTLLTHALQKRTLLYDKTGEEHYNLISALHKSIRNSDPDAGLYWLARRVEAGEDPLYIARRLIRFASEDIGNADPTALTVAVAAKDAVHFIGMPEGNTALAQAVTYLATAPKSNAVYEGYNRASSDAHKEIAEPVPLHLRNAPTALMKELAYGKDYKYAHHEKDAVTGMDCLPPSLSGRRYYQPSDRGYEKELSRRLLGWSKIKRNKQKEES